MTTNPGHSHFHCVDAKEHLRYHLLGCVQRSVSAKKHVDLGVNVPGGLHQWPAKHGTHYRLPKTTSSMIWASALLQRAWFSSSFIFVHLLCQDYQTQKELSGFFFSCGKSAMNCFRLASSWHRLAQQGDIQKWDKQCCQRLVLFVFWIWKNSLVGFLPFGDCTQ